MVLAVAVVILIGLRVCIVNSVTESVLGVTNTSNLFHTVGTTSSSTVIVLLLHY